MAEILHSSIKAHIQERVGASFDPVYLIFGEAFLFQQAAEELVNALIPDPDARKHQHEILNHAEDGQVSDVIERLNTYSFFSGRKIIELRDAALFVTRQNPGDSLQKILQAFEGNAFEKAAARFLNLLSRLQMDLSDLSGEVLADKLGIPEDAQETAWIRKLADYCLERKLSVPEAADDAERLRNAIISGFPKNNILLITTDTVDKRKALYKTITACGTVVDCSIPKGNRKADLDAQRGFLQQHMRQLLGKHQKKMDLQAFDLVFKMTGFDVRAFTVNLEKLVDYAKESRVITVDDVRSVLIRTRQDPVYELTGAVAEKNVLKSIYYLSSLLDAGFHYLQILAAITNQMRKLTVIRGFLETGPGRAFHAKMTYDQFRNAILPAIRSYDESLIDHVQSYEAAMNVNTAAATQPTPKKASSDLVIAANPANSYPVYQQFLRAVNFSNQALASSFSVLNRADVMLKTSALSPRAVLEEVIFKICDS